MRRPRHRLAVAALLTVGLAALAMLALTAGDGRRRQAPRPPLELPNVAALARAVGPGGIERHMAELERIAARNDGNRAAGTSGYRESAAYVEARLRAAGWRVSELPVPFPYFEERAPPLVRAGGRVLRAATQRFSGSGSASAGAVPVGGGCNAADYVPMPRGAIAVAARGGCLLRTIALAAQRAGAGAVVVWDPGRGGPPLAATLIRPGVSIPVVAVRRAEGRMLRQRRPLVRVRVDASSGRRVDSAVLAELGHGRRTVMAGAHLDSVPGGPGVNDNGSGVGTLLEIAEQAGRARQRPVERLRLAFWAAEEPGLYGSRHYVRKLARRSRRSLSAYLNLDIVGSANGGRFVYGGKGGRAAAGARAIRRLYRRRRIALSRVEAGDSSDHAPFRRAGVPVLGLYSGAGEVKSRREARAWGGRARRPFDSCYHLGCDRLARVDSRTLSELSDGAAAALYVMAWRP
jgi:hypothetical protein